MNDSEYIVVMRPDQVRDLAERAGMRVAKEAVGDLPDRIQSLRDDLVRMRQGMLTLQQLADHYLDGRVKVSTLRRWRREEGMPTYKRGRIRLVSIEEFEEWWKSAGL